MATTNDQIGIASDARYYGVPSLTIAWTGPVSGSHSATVYGSINKKPGAKRTQAEDNTGEVQNLRRTNKVIVVTVDAVPVASSIAGALAIAADLPQEMDILTLTCTDDTQLASGANTAICDSVDARYTPDNHVIINFTITIWLGKTFVAQTV